MFIKEKLKMENSIWFSERGYDGVPSLRIVLGGQPQTIKFLLTELKKKNPIPVIIIEGSGKSADILALAYR